MIFVSKFWICASVVMSYMYSLSRYFCILVLDRSLRVLYVGWPFHFVSSRVCLMGNACIVECTCISYSLSRRKSVRAMGERAHACCFSLGKWWDPPYFAAMCLVNPWYIVPSCPGSLSAWISCCPMHLI